MYNELIKKAVLVAAGVAIGIGGLEIILRLGGFAFKEYWLRAERKMALHEGGPLPGPDREEDRGRSRDKRVRIVCVGDSFTFGIGAPPGFSYPAQLQRYADEKLPGICKIYNCGIPGMTSGRLQAMLPSIIEAHAPDIVVVMIGKNDICNPYLSDIHDLIARNNPWRAAAGSLRIFRLMEYVAAGLAKGKRKEPSNESAAYVRQALAFELSGDGQNAEECYREAMSADEKNGDAYLYLGHWYQGLRRYQESLALYERCLAQDPYNPNRYDLWRFLFLMYQDGDGYRERISALAARIPSDDEFRNPGLPFALKEETAASMLKGNVRSIIDFMLAKDIRPVILTYPDFNANDQLKSVARERGIPLADSGKVWREHPAYAKYINPDNHPNAEGYGIIASAVGSALETMLSPERRTVAGTPVKP